MTRPARVCRRFQSLASTFSTPHRCQAAPVFRRDLPAAVSVAYYLRRRFAMALSAPAKSRFLLEETLPDADKFKHVSDNHQGNFAPCGAAAPITEASTRLASAIFDLCNELRLQPHAGFRVAANSRKAKDRYTIAAARRDRAEPSAQGSL